MGISIVLPPPFLDKMVRNLERDPTMERIIESVDPRDPIVIETVRMTYLSNVRRDLRAARSQEEEKPHHDRKAAAQFIPYFLRTKYPDRVR